MKGTQSSAVIPAALMCIRYAMAETFFMEALKIMGPGIV
jgi:hypothetical protein